MRGVCPSDGGARSTGEGSQVVEAPKLPNQKPTAIHRCCYGNEAFKTCSSWSNGKCSDGGCPEGVGKTCEETDGYI